MGEVISLESRLEKLEQEVLEAANAYDDAMDAYEVAKDRLKVALEALDKEIK